MRDEISVIVAVYNVREYLPRCIDSLLLQNFKSYEIIIVDDGSRERAPFRRSLQDAPHVFPGAPVAVLLHAHRDFLSDETAREVFMIPCADRFQLLCACSADSNRNRRRHRRRLCSFPFRIGKDVKVSGRRRQEE